MREIICFKRRINSELESVLILKHIIIVFLIVISLCQPVFRFLISRYCIFGVDLICLCSCKSINVIISCYLSLSAVCNFCHLKFAERISKGQGGLIVVDLRCYICGLGAVVVSVALDLIPYIPVAEICRLGNIFTPFKIVN